MRPFYLICRLVRCSFSMSFEGFHRAEGFAIFESLKDTKREEKRRNKRQNIGTFEAEQSADQCDQRAGAGDDGQTQRVALSACDK